MKNINIIALWVNLSRAYEIAKLGGLSIRVVFAEDYKEGSDDYAEIKEFYGREVFKATGDLIIEITKPYQYETIVRNYETLPMIEERITKAAKNIKPECTLGQSSESLLKIAVQHLNLSLKDVKRVKQIAVTIAQLDEATEIKIEHIAEAIQYRSYTNEDCGITAENNVVCFGDNIQIARTEMEEKHIKLAIAYLNKKLAA